MRRWLWIPPAAYVLAVAVLLRAANRHDHHTRNHPPRHHTHDSPFPRSLPDD